METLVWLLVGIVVAIGVTLAAPYHERLIDGRPKVGTRDGD